MIRIRWDKPCDIVPYTLSQPELQMVAIHQERHPAGRKAHSHFPKRTQEWSSLCVLADSSFIRYLVRNLFIMPGYIVSPRPDLDRTRSQMPDFDSASVWLHPAFLAWVATKYRARSLAMGVVRNLSGGFSGTLQLISLEDFRHREYN